MRFIVVLLVFAVCGAFAVPISNSIEIVSQVAGDLPARPSELPTITDEIYVPGIVGLKVATNFSRTDRTGYNVIGVDYKWGP